MGRFLNADAYASTGQGILGNNMFAYCCNCPVAFIDRDGQISYSCFSDDVPLFDRMLDGAGGLIGGAVLFTGSQLITNTLTDEKLAVKYGTISSNNDYTVYFLCKQGDPTQDIIYVGRVKTHNLNARLRYHEQMGREYVNSVSNLNYMQCRAIEQLGMVYFHSINSSNSLSNQIRGISPHNKNLMLYIFAMLKYTQNQSGHIADLIPISYVYNLTENEFLNLGL